VEFVTVFEILAKLWSQASVTGFFREQPIIATIGKIIATL